MSEDANQEDGEQLFADTAESESNPDEASTTEATESELGEESQELTLEDPKGEEPKSKASIAEENKQKQLAAWEKKINDGDAVVEDAPKWIQKQIAPPVDVQAVVKEQLELERQAQKFTELKDNLTVARLPKAEQAALQEEFKKYRDLGLPMYDALETAVKVSGVKLPTQQALDAKRKSMSLPKPGYYSDGDTDTKGEMSPDKFDRMSEEKRMEWMESQRQGQ